MKVVAIFMYINTVRILKPRRLRWAEYVAHLGQFDQRSSLKITWEA